MWMEEHIGKRVNHERVEEALDTGASKIATGCPFCRVMMTDGVDDVAAANDVPKAEVLDVAQLLLALARHEHGHAAREGHGRKGSRGARGDQARSRGQAAAATSRRNREAEPEPKPADGDRAPETKPVTGLGIAGGAKRPGPRRRPPPPSRAPRRRPPKRRCQGPRHRGRSEAPWRQEDSGRTRRARRPTHLRRRSRPRHLREAKARGQGARLGRGCQATRRQEGRGEGCAATRAKPPSRSRRTSTRTRPTPGAKTDTADSDLGVAKPEPEVKGLGIAAVRAAGREEDTCGACRQTRCAAAGTGSRRRIRRLRLSLPTRATVKRLRTAGEGPGHRKGRAAAGQALTSAKITARYRSANSIGRQ